MRLTQLAFLGLSLVACRGGGGDDGDDTPNPDGPIEPVEVTIQQVQSDEMPSGTPIELKGVIVTAVDELGGGSGGFWVAEPEGGERSGVKVFGAALDVVATLDPGDVVNITSAIKHEACTEAAPCGTIVFDNGAGITEVIGTEAGSLVVTEVGTAPLPPATMVDAKAIAALPSPQERDAEWEKYEGVLVKVINGRQLSPVETFGSNPGPDDTEFRLTGFARVQSALFQLPEDLAVGTCYESVTGILDFFFNYIIAPRDENDLVADGTGCNPMAENVIALQSAATTPELVKLDEVIVTGIDDIGATTKGFWVQDAAAGAENNGVFVFLRDQPIPAFVTIGARVDVVGGVDEFDLGTPEAGDKVTEIVNPVVTDGSGADVTPTAADVAVNILGNIGATGEPWEGVLVRAQNVRVTNIDAGAGKVELKDNSDNVIILDNESFDFPDFDAPGDCFNLTGIMHVQVNDDVRTINPRSATDMATSTGCNN